MTMKSEHEWLTKQDLSKYVGEWIAVYNKKIVGHHQTLKELQEALLKMKIDPQKPLYMRIPDGLLTLKNIIGKKSVKSLMMLF